MWLKSKNSQPDSHLANLKSWSTLSPQLNGKFSAHQDIDQKFVKTHRER